MILNKKQENEIIRAMEELNLDPNIKTSNGNTLKVYVLRKFGQFFMGYREEILETKIPINGITMTLKNVYDKLDKRVFAVERSGRPIKESVNIKLSKEIRKISKQIEEKTGFSLQKLVEGNYKKFVYQNTEWVECWNEKGLNLAFHKNACIVLSMYREDDLEYHYEIFHTENQEEIEKQIKNRLINLGRKEKITPDEFLKDCKKAGCIIRLFKKTREKHLSFRNLCNLTKKWNRQQFEKKDKNFFTDKLIAHEDGGLRVGKDEDVNQDEIIICPMSHFFGTAKPSSAIRYNHLELMETKERDYCVTFTFFPYR